RQSRYRRVPISLQLHEVDDALDSRTVAHLLAPHGGQEQHFSKRRSGDAGVASGQQVVQHRHLGEQLAMLEGAREAQARNRMRLMASDVGAAEEDPALGMINAADAI